MQSTCPGNTGNPKAKNSDDSKENIWKLWIWGIHIHGLNIGLEVTVMVPGVKDFLQNQNIWPKWTKITTTVLQTV